MHLTALSAVVAAALLPASAPFPAKTPLDVIKLATAPAHGSAHYTVSSGSTRFTIDAAAQGKTLKLHVKFQGSELWAVADGSKMRFTCAATKAVPVRCFKGDPKHIAAAVAAAAKVISNDFISTTFTPAAKLPQSKVSQTHQAGQPVSCFTLSSSEGKLRLCANNTGILTEMTAGPVRALATRVATTTTAQDFAAPATPS
jgi:hypothetical protein